MRSQDELKKIPSREWSNAEVVRASFVKEFLHPSVESVRHKNLQIVLPYFIKQYEEERKACDDMQSINPRDPATIEWNKELHEWDTLIQEALEFGTEHNVWHTKGAKCARCQEPLSGTELTVCGGCKNGKMLNGMD